MKQFTTTDDFPSNQATFDLRFNTEGACHEYLFQLRWPNGFTCSCCNHFRYWKSNRGLYICTQCEHQHSITAGTIMEGTRKLLILTRQLNI